MNALVSCWVFDRRWLFGIANPCYHLALFFPLMFNLLTVVSVLNERFIAKSDESVLLLMICLGLLCLTDLFIIIRVHFVLRDRLGRLTENVETAGVFLREFEMKKKLWGLPGFVLAIASAVLPFLNVFYLSTCNYDCLANYVSLYIDIACWSYIALVIVIFLFCKLSFLVLAWAYPETYLRYKSVV